MDKKEAIDLLKTNIEIQQKNVDRGKLNFENAKTALKSKIDSINVDDSPALRTEIFPRALLLDMNLSELELAKTHLLLLYRLLEYVESIKDDSIIKPENPDKIYDLVIDGLQTDGGHHKQWYLEEILKSCVDRDIYEKLAERFDWESGIAP